MRKFMGEISLFFFLDEVNIAHIYISLFFFKCKKNVIN